MWRCPRCSARNDRVESHCGQCGMPSPFEDGGHTRTIDVPEIRTEPPRRRVSLSWVVVAAIALVLFALLLIAVVALAS